MRAPILWYLAVLVSVGLPEGPASAVAGFPGRSISSFHPPEKIPSTARNFPWEGPLLKVVCALQVRDGVGRNQIEELNRASTQAPDDAVFLIGSIDEDEGKWPRDSIRRLFETRKHWTLPIYWLPASVRALLYAVIEPSPIYELPQFYFLDSDNRLLAYHEGRLTAEEVLAAVNRFLAPPEPSNVGGLQNGELTEWAEGVPSGWQIWDPGSSVQPSPGSASDTVELQPHPGGKRQILFQRLAAPESIASGGFRLSVRGKNPGVGKAVVALAMPTPATGEFEQAPDSPFVNREGQPIPLRIFAKCEFPPGAAIWETVQTAARIDLPARVLVILCYLERNEDAGAQAQLDWVRILPLEGSVHQTGPTR